jgi:acetyl esterase
VSPIHADLAGLPPAIVVVGTLDPLLSDAELFAEALRRAGVEAALHVFPDGPHGFVQMFALDMAAEAVGKIAEFARARM